MNSQQLSETNNQSNIENTSTSFHQKQLNEQVIKSEDVKLLSLKKQNDHLREELKRINIFLNHAIEKQSLRHSKNVPQSKDLKDDEDTLKSEMNNAQKQIEIYKKELKTLKFKMLQEYKPELVDDLKKQLEEKNVLIQKLANENKVLIRVQREQGKALKDICEEDLYKKLLTQLTEENKSLKEQLKEYRKKEPTLPVIIRNISESPDLKVHKRQNSAGKSARKKEISENEKIQEMEKTIQILQKIRKQYDGQIEQLYARIKILEETNLNQKLQLEEKSKEINQLQYRILQNNLKRNDGVPLDQQLNFQSNEQNSQSEDQVQSQLPSERKNKNLSSQNRQKSAKFYSQQKTPSNRKVVKPTKVNSISKMDLEQNLMRNSIHRVQELNYKYFQDSISIDKKQLEQLKKNQDQQKDQDIKQKENVEGKEVEEINELSQKKLGPIPATVKHLEKGSTNVNNQKFTDEDLLQNSYRQKVKILSIPISDKLNPHLDGLAIYQKENGNMIEGQKNMVLNGENYIQHTTELAQYDYIKMVSGKIGLTGNIECLEMGSCQNKVMKYGIEQMGQRKFKFEIPEYEVPVCLFGSLNQKSNTSALSSIGFLVIRDEIAEEVQ